MSKSGTIAGLGFGIALGVLGGVYVLAPNVPGAAGGAGTSAQELTAAREDADAADRDAQASDDVVAGLAAKAVAGELEGKTVALISFPDADRETVDRLRWLVDKAGAEVTPLPVTEEMLNPEKGDKLKSVAANSLPAGAQLSEEVLSPGMHTGQLLGAALSSTLPKAEKSAEGEQNRDRGEGREGASEGNRGGGTASASDRAVVFGALEKNGVLKKPADLGDEGVDLALIVTNKGVTADESGYGAQFIADFAAGLDSQMPGAVLVGESGSADKKAALGIVRNERAYAEKLSTVDNVQRSAGRITAVRALKEQAGGDAGHYGAATNAKAATVGKN
ncbi:copper transporter [Corynebacterium urealyticum]|uniref:Putative secreted protein n=1 Tax=Corynebacterium urealyticum (strain ATCC 43042 / DSM 7109) TaxID=504474 RepID=B1VH12_CORU7|nr:MULTISPECIES: copper transporter [Corynebacterium]AGE36667.1 putative secreted protein [Corynebacterium urealyticum DSM 7111]MDK6300987.1 copper transporter [Corynebacterium sp. UMB9976]QQB08297.1 copper transporter [Corynebacterium urealyticum]QQC41514.1 copper transporter [Corynebacterium urealyticum]QQE50138.1 copper transporter [Corynebacterium urealyticum]